MKVILSRKGFDSDNGGYPSIILPSNMERKMVSFPIPVKNTKCNGKTADELCFILNDENSLSLQEIFEQLKIEDKIKLQSNPTIRKKSKDIVFHFDPEIQKIGNMRSYGAFGQQFISASELREIENGDVFLFFGLFRETLLNSDGKINYDHTKLEIHAIWGYLIVDDVINVNDIQPSQLAKYPDIQTHLHCINNSFCKSPNIIICGKRFGTFNYDDKYRLTKLGCPKSIWELPTFFEGANISHNGIVKGPSSFKTHAPGQEFIVTNFDEMKMKDWLKSLGVPI